MTRKAFGIFMAPFHCPPGDNPTAAYERDLDVLRLVDKLGFDEAWIGEHHSCGCELIPDPLIFIAHAAEPDPARQARHGRRLAAVPQSPVDGRPRAVAGPPDPRALHARAGPGRPADGRDHDRPLRSRATGGVRGGRRRADARCCAASPSPPRRTATASSRRDPVRPVQRLRHRRGGDRLAHRSTAGGEERGRPAVLGATTNGGFDALALHWDVMEERAAEFGTVADREQVAAGRADAPGRDQGAGDRGRAVSGSMPGATTRSTSSPRRNSAPAGRRSRSASRG